MNDTIVGIDLGTTNSEIAVVRNGRIEVIEIENGVPILPSVVGLGDNGVLLVGAAARNQYVLHSLYRLGASFALLLSGLDDV